jgi:hypothetical protein
MNTKDRPLVVLVVAVVVTYFATPWVGGVQAASISIIPLDGNSEWQAPTGDLVLDNLRTGFTINPPGEFNERDVKSNRDNGQSFTISSDTIIDKIAINFSETQSNGGDTVFEFFAVADANAATMTPNGGIIDTVTFNSAGLGIGGNDAGTMVFDVANTVAAANSTWGIRFDTEASMTARVIKWEFANGNEDTYAAGRSYHPVGGEQNRDYTLGVIGVPEPSTFALATFGLVGLIGVRRRKR